MRACEITRDRGLQLTLRKVDGRAAVLARDGSHQQTAPAAMLPSDPDILVIVEDDDALRASLTWAFELEGYDVQAFADAESLLAEPVMPGRGCLVLDHRLPGMDGLELLRRLRARGVELPAVLITTPTPAIARAAQEARARLVEKPLVGSGLVAAVWSLTHEGPQPPS